MDKILACYIEMLIIQQPANHSVVRVLTSLHSPYPLTPTLPPPHITGKPQLLYLVSNRNDEEAHLGHFSVDGETFLQLAQCLELIQEEFPFRMVHHAAFGILHEDYKLQG